MHNKQRPFKIIFVITLLFSPIFSTQASTDFPLGDVAVPTVENLCNPLVKAVAMATPLSPIILVNNVPRIRVPEGVQIADIKNKLNYGSSFIPPRRLSAMGRDAQQAATFLRESFVHNALPYYWHSSRNHSYSDQWLTAHILTYSFSSSKLRRVIYLMHGLSHPIDDAVDDQPLRRPVYYLTLLERHRADVLESVDLRFDYIWRDVVALAVELTKDAEGVSKFDEQPFLEGVVQTIYARGMFAKKMPKRQRIRMRENYQSYLIEKAKLPYVKDLIGRLPSLYVAFATKVIVEGYLGPIAKYLPAQIQENFTDIAILMNLLYAPIAASNNDFYEIEDGDLAKADRLTSPQIKRALRDIMNTAVKLPHRARQFVMMPLPVAMEFYSSALRVKRIHSYYDGILNFHAVAPLLERALIFPSRGIREQTMVMSIMEASKYPHLRDENDEEVDAADDAADPHRYFDEKFWMKRTRYQTKARRPDAYLLDPLPRYGRDGFSSDLPLGKAQHPGE